ncbi:MAG: FkbM family methyltransferase, partial [Planctomycetaceae bacterium]
MPSRLKKVLSSVGLYGPARYLARLPYRQISEYRTQINGVAIRFDTRDPRSNAWFFPRYRNGRLHEAPITRLLIEELQDKRCFIDIGAHIGWYACTAATVFPDLKVVAFEMDGSTADQLETNARLHDTSIEVHRLAVIDQPGTVSYECPTDRPFSENRIYPDASSPNRHANATPVDAFVAEHSVRPDIIKIDV